MPKELENCVKKLISQGKNKSSAYAICGKSTGWVRKEGGGWKNTKTGELYEHKSFSEMFIDRKLNEKVYGPIQGEGVVALAEKVMQQIKKYNLWKTKVIYRGFSGNNAFNGVVRVTNDRSGFYGMIDNDLRNFIKKDLKIKNPTFATTDEFQSKMFGSTNIYVPGDNERYFVNPVVRDGLVDLNAGNISFYKEKKSLKDIHHKGEILIDTKEYFLVDPMHLDEETRSKFKPKKIKNYEDLYKMLKSFVSYWKWRKESLGQKWS